MIFMKILQHELDVVWWVCQESLGSHSMQNGVKFGLYIGSIDLI
jgi:hypothetical protein